MDIKVLFVDDQGDLWGPRLRERLAPYDLEVFTELDAGHALRRIRELRPHVVLLDVLFHGKDEGKPTLVKIQRVHPELPVVMITTALEDATLHIDTADYPGAAYHFSKADLETGEEAAYAALAGELRKAVEEHAGRQKPREELLGFVVGTTEKMRKVADRILQIAPTDATVLIIGETGTGKELVAQAIHQRSLRQKRPLMTINCGALSETLLGSELFGHERGAFTGADRTHIGLFESASGGAIFLDEVQTMSAGLQVKLLRVLQEKELTRVGGTNPVSVDVRVISATNQDLAKEVQLGRFREDLYYRIKVVELYLPPLRDRVSDLPALYTHLVEKLNRKHGKRVSTKIRADVLALLQSYSWPGNIRELENFIERAMLHARANVLTRSAFEIDTHPSSVERVVSAGLSEIVRDFLEGKAAWDALRDTYKSGPARREILRNVIRGLKEQNSKRPTSSELAKILKVSEINMRRILSSAGIRLRTF